MHIHGTDVVLFLHIFVAVVTFGVAAVLLVSLSQMKAAADMSVLRSWVRISARTGPMFPILVLVLIALGAWLIGISHSEFKWGDGWVLTSVIALVIMEGYGGVILAPADKKLVAAVNAAPDGPVPAEIRHEVLNPLVWVGAYGNLGAALGILFLMPTKPSGAASVAIVVVAAAVGVAAGLRLATASAKVDARQAGSA